MKVNMGDNNYFSVGVSVSFFTFSKFCCFFFGLFDILISSYAILMQSIRLHCWIRVLPQFFHVKPMRICIRIEKEWNHRIGGTRKRQQQQFSNPIHQRQLSVSFFFTHHKQTGDVHVNLYLWKYRDALDIFIACGERPCTQQTVMMNTFSSVTFFENIFAAIKIFPLWHTTGGQQMQPAPYSYRQIDLFLRWKKKHQKTWKNLIVFKAERQKLIKWLTGFAFKSVSAKKNPYTSPSIYWMKDWRTVDLRPLPN